MNEIAKGIQGIYLPTTDTEITSNWYIENFGMKLLRPVHLHQAQFGFGSGQSIFLIKTKEQINLNYIEINGTEQCIFTLEVNDLTGFHTNLKNNGAKITNIEDNGGCGMNFYAYDPDGNKIDVWGGWPE